MREGRGSQPAPSGRRRVFKEAVKLFETGEWLHSATQKCCVRCSALPRRWVGFRRSRVGKGASGGKRWSCRGHVLTHWPLSQRGASIFLLLTMVQCPCNFSCFRSRSRHNLEELKVEQKTPSRCFSVGSMSPKWALFFVRDVLLSVLGLIFQNNRVWTLIFPCCMARNNVSVTVLIQTSEIYWYTHPAFRVRVDN